MTAPDVRPPLPDATHHRDPLLAMATHVSASAGTELPIRATTPAPEIGIATLHRHFPTHAPPALPDP
ncbi:hypothetical protein [Streptomyces sp. NPDC088847]|uniref:hypothetical protein n=1 Tax=Streptomyces sp. NPDC088847 TaxID=3365909 RepID=UPI0037F26562